MQQEKSSIDPASGRTIRKTGNGLRKGDREAPQVSRLLTEEEIKEIIEEAVNGDA